MSRWPRLPLVLALLTPLLLPPARGLADSGPAHPIVPGFERFFTGPKADAVRGGQLLLTELNCVSCHQPTDPSLGRKQAPVLDQVAGRVRVGWLKKFLADPQAAKPGTTMPNLFAADPDRAAKVEALVHFLASTGSLRHDRLDVKAVASGRDLFHRVGCVACHGPRDAAGHAEKAPPDGVPLGDLSAKYTVGSLAAFLESPHQTRPSGRMPRLLAGKEARDVASYLLQGVKADVARGSTRFAYYEGAWDRLPDLDKLKPLATGVGGAFDLGAARRGDNYALRFEGYFKVEREGTYRFRLTSDDGSRLYLDGRQVVNNDGVHPPQTAGGSARLTKGVHKVAVAFFQGGGGAELAVQVEGPGLARQDLGDLVAPTEAALEKLTAPPAKDDPDYLEVKPDLVEKGKALFASAGCASCHPMTSGGKPVVSALKPTPLAKLKGEGGCLGAKPAKGLPWFALSQDQKGALAAAVKHPRPVSQEPAAVIARTLATFNCYACHSRDKVGGRQEALNKFFQTTQPEMGDEGRVPPPLDGVGAKLNPDYLRQILDRGAHDRPYMHTRMPGFGQANVAGLAEAFAAVDRIDPAPEVKFDVTVAKVKTAGRHMVGSQMFACIKCHTFAGQKAEGVQGIDMTLLTQRLRRDWFHAYLLDPQRIRPGTRMPAAWPMGKTFYPDLLDGKTATQIEAIWVYLKDGKSARPPVGLGKQSIPLIPTTSAILYRNFIQGAGTRAIGVGYPEKANLAFDANELRLALIWQGAFIDAARHWTDRGAGSEGPLGDNVLKLHGGAPFAVLSKSDAAWPTTAPKEMGYRFKGYRLTPDDRPTFLYTFGGVKVEDFPNAVAGKEPSLRRALTLTAARPPEGLYFRAAVGSKIEPAGDGWYRIDGWKMRVEGGTPQVRQAGGKAELLVPVRFTDGRAKIVQEFVW